MMVKQKIIVMGGGLLVGLFVASLFLGSYFNKVAYNQYSLKVKDYALEALKWSVKQNTFIDGLLEVIDEDMFVKEGIERQDYMAFMDKKIEESFQHINIEILPYEWGILSSKARLIITNTQSSEFGEIIADIEFSNILFLSKRADITLKSTYIANHNELKEFFPSGEFSKLSLYRFLGNLEMCFRIAEIHQQSQSQELNLKGLEVGVKIDTTNHQILQTFVNLPLYKRQKYNTNNDIIQSYELKNLTIQSDYTNNPLSTQRLLNSDFLSFLNGIVNNINIQFKSLVWQDSKTHIVLNNANLEIPIIAHDTNLEANGVLRLKKLSNIDDKHNIFLSQDVKNLELHFSLKNISTSVADDFYDVLFIPEMLHQYYAIVFVEKIFSGNPEIAIYDSSLLLNDKKLRFSYNKTYESQKSLEHFRISSQYSADELFNGYDELIKIKDFKKHFIKDKESKEFVYDYKSVEENGRIIVLINNERVK